jgi:nitrate/TMAO reductase-like tetraheme cytochrome c subunit
VSRALIDGGEVLSKSVRAVVILIAVGSVGWLGSDALERNNDFCNACHLSPEVPLHIDIRRGFDARPPANLAAIHSRTRETERALSGAGRCIDCHGGVGLVGRTRVKLLAARDALVWLSGDFEEPDGMDPPLGEADCLRCHLEFDAPDPDGIEVAFHELSVHNADLGLDCVECHQVHVGGDDAATFFLNAELVRGQCARCHSEFRR